MEPDLEKMLANKVHAAEQNAVPWNKTVVWEKVNGQINKQRPSKWYYHAAAAILLLLIYGAYLHWEQQKVSIRISNLEKVLHDSSDEPLKSEEVVIHEPKPVEGTVATTPTVTKNPTPQKHMIIEHVRPASEENIAQANDEMLPLSTGSDLSAIQLPREDSVEIAANNKIEPIIGIYDKAEVFSHAEMKPKRKKRIHKLDPHDYRPWKDKENPLLVARIK